MVWLKSLKSYEITKDNSQSDGSCLLQGSNYFFPTMPGSLTSLPFDQVSLGIEKNMVVET